MSALTSSFLGGASRLAAPAPAARRGASAAPARLAVTAKKKDVRSTITVECTEQRAMASKERTGVSRYTTQKVRHERGDERAQGAGR